MNLVHEIPELDAAGLREFALVTGAIIACLFGLLLPWVFDFDYPRWPWILGAILAGWGLVAPLSLNPVYRTWMRFGMLMSKVTTPIILGVVFYLVIFPIGFAMRLFGWDAMVRSMDDSVGSYRIPSNKPPKENMRRPF